MSRSQRARLLRLERNETPPSVSPYAVLDGSVYPDECPDAADALESMLTDGLAAHASLMEFHPCGVAYRAELVRLVLPAPGTLPVDGDLVEECVRLAALLTPLPCALKEIDAGRHPGPEPEPDHTARAPDEWGDAQSAR